MTLLNIHLKDDERFERCILARKSGRICLDKHQNSLNESEKHCALWTIGLSIDLMKIAFYLKDCYELMQEYELTADDLELLLQEFAV